MAGRIKVSAPELRTMDGVLFDSRHEMLEYIKLKALWKSGTIKDLELQTRFPLTINGVKVGEYWADFTCRDLDGRMCVYDAKGHKDALYKFKKKVFEACYPSLRIVEL